MAATVKCYGKATEVVYGGSLDWLSDTIKIAFCTSGYTPNQGNDQFFSDLIDEILGTGGYTAGGIALTGKIAPPYDPTTRELRFEADDVNIAALTPSSPFRYGIVYKDTGVAGTSPLLSYINFGADQNPGGLPFPIQWPPTGVMYLQAA